jgi:hypothetical protein
LFFQQSCLSDYQYLFIDLFIIIPVAGNLIILISATMGLTKSFKNLSTELPDSQLLSVPVMFSVLGLVSIQFCF